MSQTAHGDPEREINTGVCRFDLFPSKFTNVYKKDSDQTRSKQNGPSQPLGGASSFGDSSGSLFSIYSKAAEEEDNRVVERWQKDADGILIFVSSLDDIITRLYV